MTDSQGPTSTNEFAFGAGCSVQGFSVGSGNKVDKLHAEDHSKDSKRVITHGTQQADPDTSENQIKAAVAAPVPAPAASEQATLSQLELDYKSYLANLNKSDKNDQNGTNGENKSKDDKDIDIGLGGAIAGGDQLGSVSEVPAIAASTNLEIDLKSQLQLKHNVNTIKNNNISNKNKDEFESIVSPSCQGNSSGKALAALGALGSLGSLAASAASADKDKVSKEIEVELDSHLLKMDNTDNSMNNESNVNVKGDEDIVLVQDIGERVENKSNVHLEDDNEEFYLKYKHCKHCLHSLPNNKHDVCNSNNEICTMCGDAIPSCVIKSRVHSCETLTKDDVILVVDDEIDFDTLCGIENLMEDSYNKILTSSLSLDTFNLTVFDLFESLLGILLTPFVKEKRLFDTKHNLFLVNCVSYFEFGGLKEIIEFLGFSNMDNIMTADEIFTSELKLVKLLNVKSVVNLIYHFCIERDILIPMLHSKAVSNSKLIATNLKLKESSKLEKMAFGTKDKEMKMKIMKTVINQRVSLFLNLFKQINHNNIYKRNSMHNKANGKSAVIPATPAKGVGGGKMSLLGTGEPTTATRATTRATTTKTKTVTTAATESLSETFDNNNNNGNILNDSNIIKSDRIVGRMNGCMNYGDDNDDSKSDGNKSEMNEIIGQMSTINMDMSTSALTTPAIVPVSAPPSAAAAPATTTISNETGGTTVATATALVPVNMNNTESAKGSVETDGTDRSNSSNSSSSSSSSSDSSNRSNDATGNSATSRATNGGGGGGGDDDDDDDDVDVPPRKRQRLN